MVRGATVALREASVRLRPRQRHRADGPQRLGQVDAAVDPAGQPRPQRPARSSVAGADPATQPAGRRRALVGLVPQTAADLLYLETVAEECAAADGGSGEAGRCSTGWCPASPTTPTPATSRRASGWRWRCRGAGRSPPVLLLDEPTRGLDYPAKAELARILRRLADDGHAVMVATHDVEFAAVAADRVVVLAEGEVVSDGPTRAGAGRVAGVRAAGHQDPRPAAGSASTRCGG